MTWLEVDPEIAKPGWVPLIIVILLFVAVFFLWRSMRGLLRTMDPDLPHETDLLDEDDPRADGVDPRAERQSVPHASSPVSPI